MLSSTRILSLLSAAALVYSHPLGHDHVERGSLLSVLGIKDWAQPRGHPVEKLFERQNTAAFNGECSASIIYAFSEISFWTGSCELPQWQSRSHLYARRVEASTLSGCRRRPDPQNRPDHRRKLSFQCRPQFSRDLCQRLPVPIH